jgi:hypothetical protein
MHLPLSQLLFETASPEWKQRKVILTLITRRRMREVSPVGPFLAHISSEEVKALITLDKSGSPTWHQHTTAGDSNRMRSDTFRKWIASELPSHLALSFDQPFVLKFLASSRNKKGKGRPRKHKFVVGYKGYCSARNDGCPMTFIVGFTEESLKKMLQPSIPSTIELEMQVSKACMHPKGHCYGQLRGSARQAAIDQYNTAGKKPSDYAKAVLATATPEEFHSLNLSKTPSRQASYNISREAKVNNLKASGMTNCKLSNIMIAQEITRNRDIMTRLSLGDNSEDISGILQYVQLCPNFRMNMWTKASVQIFYHLCKTGKLILSVDATGNLLDFPLVDKLKGKVLHTKIAISPKYALVDSKHMRDKAVSRMVSPLILAELVSNKNTARDIQKFYQSFKDAVKEVFPEDNTASPLLCLTDCSAALESGALLAFSSSEGKTLTRVEYGNRMLVHLLHYDKLMVDIECGVSTSSHRDVAKGIVDGLRQQNVLIFLKECKSHVYRAPPTWLKMKKNSAEFPPQTIDRFDNILRCVFSFILDENRISNAIVQLCIVIAMLETERFSAPPFDDAMETKDHRGRKEIETEEHLARNIDSFIRNESEKLCIQSLEDVHAQLSDDRKVRANHLLVYSDIVERAKTMMANHCCVYLTGVSLDNDNDSTHRMGTLRCSIVYGPSRVPVEGNRGNHNGNVNLIPWKEGGFDLVVRLPFSGEGGIKNPLHSAKIAHYLKTTWMNKPAFWCRGVIHLLENAMDMQIESSNQFSEAVIRNQKHDQDALDHVSEPADYVLHRWQDTQLCHKQFIRQYDALEGRISEVERRREKKRHREEEQARAMSAAADRGDDTSAFLLTQDELTQKEEDEEGEKWSRCGSIKERDTALRNTLNEIFSGNGIMAESKKYDYLKGCMPFTTESKKMMSYGTFNDFMKGKQKSKKGLKTEHRELLQEFINMKCREKQPTATASE